MDSDLLTIPINRLITDPLFDGSFDFPFPTDNKSGYNVTLTEENGIDLVFENIPISKSSLFVMILLFFPQVHLTFKT